MKDAEDDIKIVSSEDEKIKLIGEIFSNDSSQKILKTVSSGKDMTANEIAQKNNMSLVLVTHHLKRMQEAGMIKITKTKKSVKGQDMKYYLATKQSFLIVPPEKTTHSILNSVKRFSKFAAIGIAGLVSWITLKPDGGNYQMEPVHDYGQDTVTGVERSTADKDDKWSLAESKPDVRLEDQDANIELTPESAPSYSGVDEFAYQLTEEHVNTGSISLDRTVYPDPYALSNPDSVESFVISMIIPIIVIVTGIILERLLTRWFNKRKQNKISKQGSD